jgi:hypothetical protein
MSRGKFSTTITLPDIYDRSATKDCSKAYHQRKDNRIHDLKIVGVKAEAGNGKPLFF